MSGEFDSYSLAPYNIYVKERINLWKRRSIVTTALPKDIVEKRKDSDEEDYKKDNKKNHKGDAAAAIYGCGTVSI